RMSTFLALQRTQLYSGLSATLDAYSELLELKHICCFNRNYRDACNATKIELTVDLKLHK
uniref:hypothetical protein n=1 Tax=Lacticaseibacillus paracasei TaxID=1597 RepID=UPI000ADC4F2C